MHSLTLYINSIESKAISLSTISKFIKGDHCILKMFFVFFENVAKSRSRQNTLSIYVKIPQSLYLNVHDIRNTNSFFLLI